jgi:hypothetical protein
MSSATWTINAKIVMSGLNVFNIYYTKTLKKCVELQDEVLYIPVYIYVYIYQYFTVIVPFYFIEQWSTTSIMLALQNKIY